MTLQEYANAARERVVAYHAQASDAPEGEPQVITFDKEIKRILSATVAPQIAFIRIRKLVRYVTHDRVITSQGHGKEK